MWFSGFQTSPTCEYMISGVHPNPFMPEGLVCDIN